MLLRKLGLALLVMFALTTASFADCATDVFASGDVCGNSGTSSDNGSPANLGAVLDRITAPGGNGILIRTGTATYAVQIFPTATAGSCVIWGPGTGQIQDLGRCSYDGTQLQLNLQAPSTPPATETDTQLHLTGADGFATTIFLDSYGATSAIDLRSRGGTYAAPTATASGATIGQINYQGYDGTATAKSARVRAVACETWSLTGHCTKLLFFTTGVGTTANVATGELNNGTLTLGIANSTLGSIVLEGSTSGAATISPQATAGTPTITLGTGSGTPMVTVSAPLALNTATGNGSITGAAGQVLAGATPAFTATPTLGASGTLGSLTFGNATSGLITLQPVTGALGTVTVSLPAASDTLVGKATTDTLTNKTLGATTLSGTISGGGNQINNVIIGTSTPLAGSFTTVSGSTSVTSPLIIGGSAASSTLTLESTSGAGTTDNIVFKTASQSTRMTILSNGNIGLNKETNPQASFVISNNAATGIAMPLATGAFIDADNAATAFQIMSYNNGGGGGLATLNLISARGTAASPTALLSGDFVGGGLFMKGTTAAATFSSAKGYILAYATENWSSTNNGTKLAFASTPNTTTTAAEAMFLNASGGLSIGTTTDPGIGAILANTSIKATTTLTVGGMANAATTSAVCYNTGTGVLTYDGTIGTCTVSTLAAKNLKSPLTPREGLDIVMAMEPWRYDLKEGLPTWKPGEQIGFVAEFAVKREPRLVATSPGGKIDGFLYEQYTAALTGAVQYLVGEIKAARADNDDLRGQISDLRARMNQ